MVTDAMRALVAAGGGAGALADARARTGTAEHAVCGDEVAVSLLLEAERIADLRWQARGCPATLAVAAAAWQCLRGVALADAPLRLGAELARLGGLQPHERHAERILLDALAAAAAEA
jgi:NifU-like protein involved in Fe-S cluster formation